MKRTATTLSLLLGGFLAGALFVGVPAGVRGQVAGGASSTGDTNGDGRLDVSDAVYLLLYFFQGGEPPAVCADSPDLAGRVAALEADTLSMRVRLDAAESAAVAAEAERAVARLAIASLATSVNAHEEDLEEWREVAPFIDRVDFPIDVFRPGVTVPVVRFSRCSVQITDGGPQDPQEKPDFEVEGLGNLVIGRGEFQTENDRIGPTEGLRTGTHNLVVGQWNDYAGQFNLAVGNANSLHGSCSAVVGTANTQSDGSYNAVAGATESSVTGQFSFIGGGFECWATSGSVVGGYGNSAVGSGSVMVGGSSNRAESGSGELGE